MVKLNKKKQLKAAFFYLVGVAGLEPARPEDTRF